jgi:hypothetical protein
MKARQSYLAIPILGAERSAVGVAYFDAMRVDAFGPGTVDALARTCLPLSQWVR